ncbi:hypothetical protein SAMN05877838_0225 [Hoeflea halophila]|uniref:Uncharacterized protein n=2 Tax=Hoeflea halophila TaxID=714899 RepID=A0A286HL04_9HYPH|nr:hypothetical protein SAMN05877838_0225 [Hoeflea halophila]
MREGLLEASKLPDYAITSFEEFVGNRSLEFYENLDAFGVDVLGSELNEAKQEFRSEFERDEPLTAMQRAEGLANVFIDAATELAALINAYKLEEIETAINDAEVRSANLPRGDVEALKASFAEIEHLKAIQSQLRRPTRHTMATFRAKQE